MKKILSLLFVLSMILALAACGGGKTALSVEEFNARVTGMGFELEETPSLDELAEFRVTGYSFARRDTQLGRVDIEYATFQDQDALMVIFDRQAANFQDEPNMEMTSENGLVQYRMHAAETTHILLRTDKALLELNAHFLDDAEVDRILSELGFGA